MRLSPEALFSLHKGLPKLKQAIFQPPLFEDSTHRLWQCDTDAGAMMLKLCQSESLADSACWQIIEQLFDLRLPEHLAHMPNVRQLLLDNGHFPIPEVIACSHQTDAWPGFMLSRWVSGQRLTTEQLTDTMVRQLAQQMASLHQCQSDKWGQLINPEFAGNEWSPKLITTIETFTEEQYWLNKAIEELGNSSPSLFCPIMLDNRWDQYLFDGEEIISLVDIDAFVFGPAELELVLLEYQLNAEKAQLFSKAYQEIRPMPELNSVRLAYRLLLFSMNALGQASLEQWMNTATRF